MRPLYGEHLFSLKCSASQLPVLVFDPERSYETLTFETLFPTGTRPQLYTMCCYCDVAVMLWYSHAFHGRRTLLLVSHLQRSLESIWSGLDVCWSQGLRILMTVFHPLQSGSLPSLELSLFWEGLFILYKNFKSLLNLLFFLHVLNILSCGSQIIIFYCNFWSANWEPCSGWPRDTSQSEISLICAF